MNNERQTAYRLILGYWSRLSIVAKRLDRLGWNLAGSLWQAVIVCGYIALKGGASAPREGEQRPPLNFEFYFFNWIQRLGSKGPSIGNGLWWVEWSHKRWCHRTLKGQGRDPTCLRSQYSPLHVKMSIIKYTETTLAVLNWCVYTVVWGAHSVCLEGTIVGLCVFVL